VYCLSGLGIVRKSRRIPKHFSTMKVFVLSRTNCFYIESASFFTILLATSLHGLKKTLSMKRF